MNLSSLVGHITELLQCIQKSHQPADRTTAAFFKGRRYLGAKDRRFISEGVFGIIRHRRLLEALLERFQDEHPSLTVLNEQHARFLALYAVFTSATETILDPPPESVWNLTLRQIPLAEFTEWMSSHASLGFLEVDNLVRLGVKYSFQDWMVNEWFGQIGEDVERLLQSLNSPSHITLRVNLLKTTQEECRQRLLTEGIETVPTPISLSGLIARKRFSVQSSAAFNDGWFEMQDEGSQLVSLIAAPVPGNVVIDACAGAGGKSLHLAQLMNNQGELIAVDLDHRRLDELRLRAVRAGVGIIRPLLRAEVCPENLAGKADLVLIDAPCSGMGTIRRNPWLKWSISESLISHVTERQHEILSFNAQFVKPGGKLMYATCSLLRQENEEIAGTFLSEHNNFQAMDSHECGIESNNGQLNLYPHIHDTDGFFLAVFRKADL